MNECLYELDPLFFSLKDTPHSPYPSKHTSSLSKSVALQMLPDNRMQISLGFLAYAEAAKRVDLGEHPFLLRRLLPELI